MITVGADPEFFIKDTSTGKIISAVGIVEGSKDEPLPLEWCRVQRDNVLLEINLHPCSSRERFEKNVRYSLAEVSSYLRKKNENLVITGESSSYLDSSELKDEEAYIFGCSPDYDSWEIDTIDTIDPFKVGNFRTCGGHVHIGFEYKNIDELLAVAKTCDLLIGLPSVLYDKDRERRKLYGQASRFRPKSYGLEYRTPSNFWMFSQRATGWIFRSAVKAVQQKNRFAHNKEVIENILDIKRAINESDAEKAKHYLEYLYVDIDPDLVVPEYKSLFSKSPTKEEQDKVTYTWKTFEATTSTSVEKYASLFNTIKVAPVEEDEQEF